MKDALHRLCWVAVLAMAPSLAATSAWGAERDRDGAWTKLPEIPAAVQAEREWIRPERYTPLELDMDLIRGVLSQAPTEQLGWRGMTIDIPTPVGDFARFRIVETALLPEPLRKEFPNLRTYIGQGVDDPTATVHITIASHGFNASVVSAVDGDYYVDPFSAQNSRYYTSYYASDHRRQGVMGWKCLTPHDEAPAGPYGVRGMPPGLSGSELRTYRVAVIATTNWVRQISLPNAPTVERGLAEVTTVINRLNQVVERELSIRLVLIPQQTQLIFVTTTPAELGDPATNNPANHTYLERVIGAANYDTGHSFGIGGDSGNAGAIGTVCRPSNKGQGWSITQTGIGDRFALKLVSHEFGHSFGGWHTFNSCSGGQAGQATSAVEPGAGSTIMSYKDICNEPSTIETPPDANNGLPIGQYHSANFFTQSRYLTGVPTPGIEVPLPAPCGVVTPTGNTPPSVDAGLPRTIPAGTPFALTATAMDADGDTLTYSWEQLTNAPPLDLLAPDNGTGPLFRVFPASISPTRNFPNLNAILTPGTGGENTARGEKLPLTSRTLQMRVTVRDNRAGSGGIATDDVILTVAPGAGPFRLTAPNGGGTVSGATTVTWNVANTNVAPINTQFVRIRLSDDGGQTFPYLVGDNVPNTGTAQVLLPNINTALGRMKVEAVDNYYFDISNANFTVLFVPPGTEVRRAGNVTVSDDAGTCNRNGFAEAGESGVGLIVPLRNEGATEATAVSATLVSRTSGVTVLRADSTYANMAYNTSANNAQPYRIALAPNYPCGQPINLTLQYRSTGQGSGASGSSDFSIPTGFVRPPARVVSNTRRVMPDNNPVGVTFPVTISGLRAPITNVVLKVAGTNCSSAAGSPTVGLAHNTVGQLVLSLSSPSGSSVTLWNLNGGNGNNMCQTEFNDAATTPVTQLLSTNAPFTGSFQPFQPLAGFNGTDPNGVWTLRSADTIAGDTGSLAFFELTVTGATSPECNRPVCPADVDDGSGTGRPDGGVELSDLLFYLNLYELGDVRADVDNGSGLGERDQGVSLEDLLYFLGRYDGGC